MPWTADFTRDIALNYVKRGYHLLCRHAVTLLLMPVAATVLVRSQAEHAVVAFAAPAFVDGKTLFLSVTAAEEQTLVLVRFCLCNHVFLRLAHACSWSLATW